MLSTIQLGNIQKVVFLFISRDLPKILALFMVENENVLIRLPHSYLHLAPTVKNFHQFYQLKILVCPIRPLCCN